MKVIGKWSRIKGNINVTIPKIRKVGGKRYPLKAKYLYGDDDPLPLKDQIEDVENDLSKELSMKIKLISTSSRGGDIMEVT
jgi:hypothetical protein